MTRNTPEEAIILNNRYRLEERQGSGGMAMVFRAQDIMLERTVAIKILRQSYSRDPEFRERFRQEAKAAANLSHSNIVTVHDFGLDSNQLFIVMEYVPGIDLKSHLKQRTRLEIPEALDLMVQACAGIGYAHRAGLVHCDVKPQNMLVTPDHRLKVVDFGIARALATISEEERSDTIWGSPQYFSPEQAAGYAPSPASDVYSLGVILYELLTGQLPFAGSSPEELARQHRESLPPSPRKLNPSIPTDLEHILIKVLAKEPNNRYRTANQLGRVLANLSRHPMMVSPVEIDEPSKNLTMGISNTPPEISSVQKPLTQTSTEYSNPKAIQSISSLPSTVLRQPKLLRRTRTIAPRNTFSFDWVTWVLGLLALIALGGLIPFWLWVYYVLNPPI